MKNRKKFHNKKKRKIGFQLEKRYKEAIRKHLERELFLLSKKDIDSVESTVGYLNNDAANKELFDTDGWFNTGDLVYLDKNNQYHFAGRKKQVIVLDSGKNVYPDELEALFIEIDGVKNVAVFEHKVKDKTVTYGVFQVDENMTMEKLAKEVANANKKVASYKWVTHFAMTRVDLPMTSTQKVKHHVVRQNLIDGKYPNKHE